MAADLVAAKRMWKEANVCFGIGNKDIFCGVDGWRDRSGGGWDGILGDGGSCRKKCGDDYGPDIHNYLAHAGNNSF